jgi:Na+-translocating ferredoxin:NAD+ oxidoreductase RNF subunit RnfB
MGKLNKNDREKDCSACGYISCKEMAVQIFNNNNVKENCIEYKKHQIESSQKLVQKQFEELSATTQHLVSEANKLA